jgi:hypothetical protein
MRPLCCDFPSSREHRFHPRAPDSTLGQQSMRHGADPGRHLLSSCCAAPDQKEPGRGIRGLAARGTGPAHGPLRLSGRPPEPVWPAIGGSARSLTQTHTWTFKEHRALKVLGPWGTDPEFSIWPVSLSTFKEGSNGGGPRDFDRSHRRSLKSISSKGSIGSQC